uniref:TonB family protein n=1 Tax=candidate division WOR-3 bacterium TaxID=2052148 RepID=A0A7C4GGZ4_UNCW3
MKPDCESVRDLLGPYLDAELAEPKRRQVELHLKTCPECRRELTELETLYVLARRAARPGVPDEHLDHLRMTVTRKLRREAKIETARPRLQSMSLFRLATVGGALVVMIVVVIAGYRLLGDRSMRLGTLSETGPGVSKTRSAAEAVAETTFTTPTGSGRAEAIAEAGRRETRGKTAGAGSHAMRAMEDTPEPAEFETKTDKDPGRADADNTGENIRPPAPASKPFAVTPGIRTAQSEPEAKLAGVEGSSTPDEARSHSIELDDMSWPDQKVFQRDTGTVELLLWVEPDSSISSVRVLRSSGSPALDSFALFQALRAKAVPEFKDGRPVRTARRVEFRQPAAQSDDQ